MLENNHTIHLTLNGESRAFTVEPQETLLHVLRERAHLTGAKKGCDLGECGACTVIMDGRAVNSCCVFAIEADGSTVETIKGIGTADEPHPLQQTFIDAGAIQCGYCTPGMIMAAKALLDRNSHPTREEIHAAMSGNLCRCTGYTKIEEAVVADGVPADQKHRHRRRQHHAGPPLHLLQPPHLWRSGLAYCFKTGGSICHQIPNSPVCRAIYYSDVATALIAYEAEVEYIEDGETHRTDLKSLIERHSVANGLACHEHLPILVTRFFVPAAEEGERSGFYKYAMRTTIDFPIINFALRCGGKRPARLAAGAVAPHPVVMAETAAKIDSDATDDEVIAQAEDELRKLAMPIREACMTPAVKRSLYRHVAMLLDLRK